MGSPQLCPHIDRSGVVEEGGGEADGAQESPLSSHLYPTNIPHENVTPESNNICSSLIRAHTQRFRIHKTGYLNQIRVPEVGYLTLLGTESETQLR